MSIVSLTQIEAGEEVFVDYNYRLWQAPPWFQEQWIQHQRDAELLSEENILDTIRRISNQYGVYIEFPFPKRGSKRFLPCIVCNLHVGLTEPTVSCKNCANWFHVRCTDICLESISKDEDTDLGWHCYNCRIDR